MIISFLIKLEITKHYFKFLDSNFAKDHFQANFLEDCFLKVFNLLLDDFLNLELLIILPVLLFFFILGSSLFLFSQLQSNIIKQQKVLHKYILHHFSFRLN
jgi:hypothetical protein